MTHTPSFLARTVARCRHWLRAPDNTRTLGELTLWALRLSDWAYRLGDWASWLGDLM